MEKAKQGQDKQGPNRMVHTDIFKTTDMASAVKIRMSDETSQCNPISLPGLMEAAVAANPDMPALAFKKDPEETGFHFISFKEYLALTRTVAKAFLKLGLERLHSVAIIGFNSPQWFVAYLGCIYAGGVACGVYATNSPEATQYCLEKGLANLAVVEDDSQVKKILKVKEKLPQLKAVIQYTGQPKTSGVLSWEELLNIGRNENDKALNAALKRIAINECCTLIYTSGTTGNPKGAMLSHDNLIWNACSTASMIDKVKNERLISYLPLSHVAALLLDIFSNFLLPATIYFANKDALRGGLLTTLLEVRPTRFMGVPRVWEKIWDKIKMVKEGSGPLKKCILTWAQTQGQQRITDLMNGTDRPKLLYLVARAVVFSKVKKRMGLDFCKSFWTGAAPLSTDLKLSFASLDIPLMEVFGMSETSGVHSFSTLSAFRFNTAGKTLPGAQTKIHNPDRDNEGEICMYGRHVFMGYLGDKEHTDSIFDESGWLHSGDIGKLDKEGFLAITGRIKELLITAGGENISPVAIEQNVKAELPFLGQAVVICDRKKFLSLLITLSNEIDTTTGESKDELTPEVKKWLKDLGFSFEKTSQVLGSGPDDKIMQAIQKGIDAANEKAISSAQRIQKFAILPRDFSIASGELGPTLKLKRNVINEKYKLVIDKLYDS